MDIIVECDLGRDADDFFALCYLVACGVDIRAITVSPGDKDQIAVAKFLCEKLGLNIPVGSAKPEREKSSVGGVHVHLLNKYGWPDRMDADGLGGDIIASTLNLYPDCELFAIGPLQSVRQYLQQNPDTLFVRRATMQGGFAGYHLHEPQKRMKKFDGLETCPTFNLGGDKKGGQLFVETPQIKEKRFVGKNVCHTIVYGPTLLEEHRLIRNSIMFGTVSERWLKATYLFLEAMTMFFDRGAPEKMFHDPTAAVCMLHPEIGTWIDGTVYYDNGKWGTKIGGPHKVLVDIDRERLWKHIFQGN